MSSRSKATSGSLFPCPQQVSIFVLMHVASRSQYSCHSSRLHILTQLSTSSSWALFSGRRTSPRNLTREGSCVSSRPGSAPTFPKIKTSSIQCSGFCEQGEGWDDFEPRNQVFVSGSSETRQGEGARVGNFMWQKLRGDKKLKWADAELQCR